METHRKESHGTSEVALSEGAPRIAGDHQKLGTAKEGFYPTAFRGSTAFVDF